VGSELEVGLCDRNKLSLLRNSGTLVMGSIITSDLVPIEIRGTYQSYINIIYGAGSALGAATGGAIADSLGWRWEFGFQIPFLSLCLLLAIFVVPRNLGLKEGVETESLREAFKKFDYKGSLLITTSITTLILGLVRSYIKLTERC
jgi:MFS family permease